MTEEEFRTDLLSSAASRAAVVACSAREAFTTEVLERLAEAEEVPDADICPEIATGNRGRKLEIDAWAFDEADDSLHLFVSIYDASPTPPKPLGLTEARELGFNRALGVFEQSRDGWLTANLEESRPLWAIARKIQRDPLPSALRLHVLSDRPVSERIRAIPEGTTAERIPITFQIWDLSRLRRIHDARSARDDLLVEFYGLPEGGLQVLPASVASDDYKGFLAGHPRRGSCRNV